MNAGSPRRHPGFTLIEVLVVVGIIAILAGIMFPVFAKAREKGRQTQCLSNQKQIAVALTMYSDDLDRYPEVAWYTQVQGVADVLACPVDSDAPLGYGLNGYLHAARPSSISRASDIIATVDSSYSSTVEAVLNRHTKGAIYSRLDGSAMWAREAREVGRFACGKFPIVPVIARSGVDEYDGKPLPIPDYFSQYASGGSGVEVTKDFLIAGPYGEDTPQKWNKDFIAEESFAATPADASPEPGFEAPELAKIADPASGDAPVDSSGAAKKFQDWTKPEAADGVWSLQSLENYNCKYFGRTTYAVTYIFSPEDQDVALDWWCDDVGKIWLNGELIASEDDGTEVNPGTPTTQDIPITLPRGISFMLIKTTNNSTSTFPDPGGMKFKLRFKNAAKTLGFSDHLE